MEKTMELQQFITTERLKTAYYRAGENNEKKLLLIHGNVSSSVFYLPLFPALSEHFDVVAPDLRCFGDSDALPVDATRGFGDWCDDLLAFVDALGWDEFAIAGWSMGGDVVMQFAIEHAKRLTGLILINPGSPFGFGGTRGEEGKMMEPHGIASGGGCTNPQMLAALEMKEREYPRITLNTVYFKPPYRADPVWEERFIDAMLKTKVGLKMYPGTTHQSVHWPHIVAGDWGVCNTMAPNHCDLSALADISPKPPILWIRGDGDIMVSDTSICDFGYLGQQGKVPGWPGEDIFPPQPMVAQTRYLLKQYDKKGGTYREVVLPGGHGCHLESPDEFTAAVEALLL